ncbi:hypothetical protein ABTL60_19715, partial [Acinetobacter baumannii]
GHGAFLTYNTSAIDLYGITPMTGLMDGPAFLVTGGTGSYSNPATGYICCSTYFANSNGTFTPGISQTINNPASLTITGGIITSA